MSPTQEAFLAELESLGVGAVKERIATNVYLGGLKNIAQGWVDRQEAASSAEQIALSRQTIRVAQTSNKIALAAVVIAAISMFVSTIALLRH
ncbi:MAG: hypothetical protein WB760_12265 [Xanthobacteraceae bacterium]